MQKSSLLGESLSTTGVPIRDAEQEETGKEKLSSMKPVPCKMTGDHCIPGSVPWPTVVYRASILTACGGCRARGSEAQAQF